MRSTKVLPSVNYHQLIIMTLNCTSAGKLVSQRGNWVRCRETGFAAGKLAAPQGNSFHCRKTHFAAGKPHSLRENTFFFFLCGHKGPPPPAVKMQRENTFRCREARFAVNLTSTVIFILVVKQTTFNIKVNEVISFCNFSKKLCRQQ